MNKTLDINDVIYNELPGRVANPRPVARIKTGRIAQPITDVTDVTGRDRCWNATRPRSTATTNL